MSHAIIIARPSPSWYSVGPKASRPTLHHLHRSLDGMSPRPLQLLIHDSPRQFVR